MLAEALDNIDTELDEISDRIKFIAKNKKFTREDYQNLNIAVGYIGAALRVINDVKRGIDK